MSVTSNFATSTAACLIDILSGDGEAALVAQARIGSSSAIEALVSRYEARLFRLAQNITANAEDAEEVVQNAFFKAFQNLAAFRGDSRFYTWIVRIAMNEALMKKRTQRVKPLSIDNPTDVEDHAVARELVDWAPNPEQRYSQEELRTILQAAIQKLEPAYRIVFQLRDVEGFSSQETARTLNLSLPAVKTRLRRARFRLRDSLNIYFRARRRPASGTRRALRTRSFVDARRAAPRSLRLSA